MSLAIDYANGTEAGDERRGFKAVSSEPGGSSSHLLILTGLLCSAVLIAVIAAIAVTSSSASVKLSCRRRQRRLSSSVSSSVSSSAEAQSAPTTRRCSLATGDANCGAAKFASSDQLDRIDNVNDSQSEELGAEGNDPDEAVSIGGLAELRMCTKLDLAEGILYLYGFRLRFEAKPPSTQLDRQSWLCVIEIAGGSGAQQWRIEAGLTRRDSGRISRQQVAAAASWQTDTIDYVASLRLNVGRLSSQLPHQRRLTLTVWAAREQAGCHRRLPIGELRFPLHLVNEPLMEFSAEVAAGPAVLGVDRADTRWRQLRPLQFPLMPTCGLPRLHLGLLFSPGSQLSSVCVRLIEVFDLDASGCVAPVTATIAVVPADQSKPTADNAVRLAAKPSVDRSAHVFDWSEPAPVLAIDNARLQAANVGVLVCVAIGNEQRPAGRVLLGDFSLASCSSAMRQWTAAMSHANAWVWLTHACR